MSQFIFPPLTASLDSEASDGGSLPSAIMIVGGYDGANTQVIKTDADGNLQVDILSSSTITVTGTVTLGAGTAAFGKLSANSGVDIGDVDVTSSALPSGAATSALQGTANGILTTIDADTGNIAGAISGTEMQVDVVAALPTGSNAIGKLAAGTASIGSVTLNANSGVDIGDVDVTSVIPGVGATNLGKAIQSAQGTTDTGVPALVVRNDTLADLAGSDHDYAPLQVNASGALYVEVKTSGLPSGAATEAKQDTIETTLTAIETDADTIAGAVSGTEMQVDVVASLPAGSNNIGDVDIASALPAGTNSIGTVILGAGTASIGKLGAIAPIDFLDAGVFDASTGTNIPSTGSATLVTLAAACTEIEVVDDIGEYMSLRVGGAVKAYLPLGGGRVKVTLGATNAVTLYSETGTTISSGKIAINFLA